MDFILHAVTAETVQSVVENDLVMLPTGANFEHFAFNFGPGRFDANPDSLIEHSAFREAIAHAINRDRIADVVYGGKIDAIDSYVEVFSPSRNRTSSPFK